MKFAAVILLVVAVAVNAEPLFGFGGMMGAPSGRSATNMFTDMISGGAGALAGGVAGAVEGLAHGDPIGGMIQGGENGLIRGSSSLMDQPTVTVIA